MQETRTLLHDRYLIVHIERTGSFSKVFFALDTYQTPHRSCVVKVFEPIAQKIQIAKWIEQKFQQEAKHLKQLSLINRHLPEIYNYSSEFRVCYLVRELIEGETLSKKVISEGKFSAPQVREILSKLLSVVHFLHQKGVIHQNIKPKNIILRHEDRLPMLINFGSIKQIVSTYGFYGDKQIFFTNNTYGYAPPEQALGRSVFSCDLYSLGLTAVYLLTGKNPVDLSIDPNSGDIKIPQEVFSQDFRLAQIITQAIKSNLGDRYSSAAEMINDLRNSSQSNKSLASQSVAQVTLNKKLTRVVKAQPQKSNFNNHQPLKTPLNFVASNQQQNRYDQINWGKLAIYVLSTFYIIGAGIIAWYDWKLDQNSLVYSLPPTVYLPSTPPQPPPSKKHPLILNDQSGNLIEIPIFTLKTDKKDLRAVLGEPNAIQKGYWQNSSAWIYKNRANNSIDLGYLFDLDTDQLRQTELAISPSIGLKTTKDILNSLLEGNMTPLISQELQRIYHRQATEYYFKVGKLEGSIQREKDNHIYLGVWEAAFH